MPKRKALFINPRLPEASWLNSAVAGVSPPLGLAYMAAFLRQRGYEAAIIDGAAELLSSRDISLKAAAFSPSVIGLTSTTTSYLNAAALAAELKRVLPGVPVVMGGAHASALPEQVLKDLDVDAVVLGEGENAFHNLAEKLLSGGSLSGVKGTAFRERGEVVVNPPEEPVKDLDSLPFPAYDLLPMRLYHPSLSRRLTTGRFGALVTSRGCPHSCSFCSHSVFGHTYRERGPANVIKEIELLKKEYGIEELIIWDDTFTVDPARALEIARGIKKVSNAPWSCYSRVSHADEDLYSDLRDCGLKEILFGAESGCAEILNGVNKGITPADTERAVSLARLCGISTFCSVILGLPGDTRETIGRTMEFFKRVDPDYAAFCVLIPFPGSPLFDEAVRRGLIDPARTDWDSYVTIFSTKPPPCSMCEVPAEELVNLQKRAFREFLFRGNYVSGRLGKALRDGPFRFAALSKGLGTVVKHQLYRHFT